MYFDFSVWKAVRWTRAQWGQVIETYSTIVTGALGSPRASSPSGPGTISSLTSTVTGFSASAGGAPGVIVGALSAGGAVPLSAPTAGGAPASASQPIVTSMPNR